MASVCSTIVPMTLVQKYMKDSRGVYRACAGAILFNHRKELLICKRNTTQWNTWQFPQGGVEEDETEFRKAATREASEELGIPVDRLEFFNDIPTIFYYDVPADSWLVRQGFKGQAISFSLLKFEGSIEDLDLTVSHDVGQPPEFSEAKWMPISAWDEQLSPFVVDFKKDIYTELKHNILALLPS